MSDLYTSLYGPVPTGGVTAGAPVVTNAYGYKGPSPHDQGQTVTRVGTYTGTIANGDVLHLGALVPGERLVSFDVSMSGDPDTDNDGAVDVGTTTDPNGILAASNAFQAGADVNVEASGQAVPGLVAVKGDEYLLTMTTGEHEASVTYTFTIVSAL